MGAEYRLTTLQKYADYVRSGKDFPLTQFTSRHSPATEAVGYGKALMFFHMLRLKLGDRTFIAALREFYQKYKFQYADFGDLEKSFETASGKDLQRDFKQWVAWTGAPEIRLEQAAVKARRQGYVVTGRLEQVQPGHAYRLRIPAAVTLEGQDRAYQTVLKMDGKKLDFSVAVESRPLRLDIDPEFDVFRKLDRDEIPPAISQALGAKKMLILLPSAADKDLLQAYEDFSVALAEEGPDQSDVKLDSEITKLPADRAVAVLGWENRFANTVLAAVKGYGVTATNSDITIGNTLFEKTNHDLVLAARNPENKDAALLLIAGDPAESFPGLARKLPHYHKYSYLAFEGEKPANIAKGRWPVVDSPLTVFFRDRNGNIASVKRGKLAPREALTALPPLVSEERMMEAMLFFASDQLNGRELRTPELDKAADYRGAVAVLPDRAK